MKSNAMTDAPADGRFRVAGPLCDGGDVYGGDDGDQCRDLVGARGAAHDAEHRALGDLVGAHSGMFPCFLGGSAARLVRRARSALVICARVSLGRITASM